MQNANFDRSTIDADYDATNKTRLLSVPTTTHNLGYRWRFVAMN